MFESLKEYAGSVVSAVLPFGETAKVSTGEVATISSMMTGLSIMSYNPDDLVRSKGKGIKVYQEMIRDSHVKAALKQKKSKLLKIGWEVVPASDNKVHQEQAAFVKWNLETRLAGAFNRDLFEMLDALDCGFSVSEKVFEIMDSGKWKGKAAYKNIKSKDPLYFDFKTDDYGNLEKKGLLLSTGGFSAAPKGLPVDKFIIVSNDMRYENFYGSSDLRAAYRPYWLKDTAWKLRAIYMERFAGNNLKGKYPKNDEKAKDKLLEIFQAWQSETGIAIPEGVEIEVLQLATSSKSEYESTIDDCNKEIQVAIIGQTLTMDTGEKGNGSRALGQVHHDVLADAVWFLDSVLTSDVNIQAIRHLVDLNWDTEEYPTWRFKSREGIDNEAYTRTINNLLEAGADISENHVLDKLRIPKVLPGEKKLVFIPKPGPPATEAQPEKMGEQDSPSPQPSPPGGEGEYLRELNRFELFAELPRIEKETDELVSQAKETSVPIYEGIRDDILKQVEKRKVFDNGGFEVIEKITVNIGPLKQLLADTFLKARLMGRADILKQAAVKPSKFAEEYVPDEALAALAKKTGISKADFDALAAEVKAQSFTVAGLEKATIDKEVKTLLMQSLKAGDDFKAFNFKLGEKFIKYAMPVYGGVGAVGDTILDYHAETIFRNGVMDAYNEGRHEQLLDPDVSEIFPAMRLSAVRDGRTRPIHAMADGLTFMVNDPVWRRLRPPNGHNCREVLIPISKWDFTREMLSKPGDIPQGYPDAGFGG
ncbi:MAG: DUF935 family protein [Desulfobacteraceae bacterium]|nr:DUF935 family protein [Desulfobacteraceae bacterium]